MSYYALLVPPYIGHLNPLFALGHALQARGHRIAFVSLLDSEAKVRKAGFEFIPIAVEEFPRGQWEQMSRRNAELTGLRASRYLCAHLAKFTHGIFRDLPQIAAREHFDGLIMDQVCPGAESVCQVIGLPLALACCALIFHAETRVPPIMFTWSCRESLPFRVRNFIGQMVVYSTAPGVVREIARYRFKQRLPQLTLKDANETPPSLVQVSQQPAFFDFERKRLPDHFHYTGPWLDDQPPEEPDFPWDKLDGRPLIYASLGTLQNRLFGVFRMIAEACAGLDAQLVIALGSKTTELSDSLPGKPIVVGYAPQLALLKRSSLVITHAGLNTTLEALREGLPMIALPITNDQPGVAARIKHLGVGEFIPATKVTASGLRNLIIQVQTISTYREQAGHFAREMNELNGASRAAELIEQAFTTRKRVLRDKRRP